MCLHTFQSKNTNNSAARCRDIYNNFKPVLSINGQKILPVKSTKFLGIIIDDKLCWDDQITYLENKLRGCLVVIKRIMTCIPKSQHINIYNSLFLSHMTYGINSWGGVPCYKLETLFAIQNDVFACFLVRKNPLIIKSIIKLAHE